MSEIKTAFDKWVATFDTESDEWQDMIVDRVYEQGWKDSRQALEGEAVAYEYWWPESPRMKRICKAVELEKMGGNLISRPLIYGDVHPTNTAVPKGWKLVPVEPTSDMLGEIHLDVSFSHRAMTVRYRAMLDAAPEAPVREKEHE